jgi:membrane protein involved in colicin uptake
LGSSFGKRKEKKKTGTDAQSAALQHAIVNALDDFFVTALIGRELASNGGSSRGRLVHKDLNYYSREHL